MNKEEFINKRMQQLKGMPKYANSEKAIRSIATSEWEANKASSKEMDARREAMEDATAEYAKKHAAQILVVKEDKKKKRKSSEDDTE